MSVFANDSLDFYLIPNPQIDNLKNIEHSLSGMLQLVVFANESLGFYSYFNLLRNNK